jgi:hypothetical protein
MFGRKRDKLHVTITVDDTVDIRAVRDFLITVVLRKFSFIRHASATFGIGHANQAAEDYEATRAYEGIAGKIVKAEIEDNELENLKDQVSDLQDKIDERIALN